MVRDSYIQALRGLAIGAVVLIHCLPQEFVTVLIRPFLNFSVALFVFLSGYLTSPSKISDSTAFWHKRLMKILPPYVIWSLFYLIARGHTTLGEIILALVTGGASGQLYFLLVYSQLVLLTPWLVSAINKPYLRIGLYAITPVLLGLHICFALFGLELLYLEAFCGTWLIFYLIGLEWKERILPLFESKKNSCAHVFAVWLCCAACQAVSGLIWFGAGNFDMATTQLRLTSMLSSVMFISVMMLVSQHIKSLISSNQLLVSLGDMSFSVYLCHMVPIMVWNRFLLLEYPVLSLLKWTVSLILSIAFVSIAERFLPTRIKGYLGLSS